MSSATIAWAFRGQQEGLPGTRSGSKFLRAPIAIIYPSSIAAAACPIDPRRHPLTLLPRACVSRLTQAGIDHITQPPPVDSPRLLAMRASSILAAFALIAATGATELTPDNWEEETIGRTVFIKFLAPW